MSRTRLRELTARNPHRISGGEKQRLALATVELQDPDVLLLDEPVAFLDPEMTARCVEFVANMKQNGAAVLWATPGGDDLVHAERVVYLSKGRIEFDGTRDSFFAWARENAVSFEPPSIDALATGISEAAGIEPAASIENVGVLARSLDGAGLRVESHGIQTGSRGDSTAAARLHELAFSYGEHRVLDDINADIGGCTGITGPNASGKTTLLLLAAGALEPEEGRVTHLERPGGVGPRIVFIPQSPERMFFAETVAEELAFGPTQNGVDPDVVQRRIVEALETVGFDAQLMMPRSPLELSTGEMRRVAFAVALVLDPHFVLFDEPTAGLDHDGRRVFLDIVASFRARETTIAIASHDTAMLCEACDRIIFLTDRTVETTLELVNGEISDSWPPGNVPLILALQDELETHHHFDVRPRAVTVSRFASRVAPRHDPD